jgi:hypothetical protein
MALTEKPALLAANDLWILLSLGRMQLERLRPLLDAQSEENPGGNVRSMNRLWLIYPALLRMSQV